VKQKIMRPASATTDLEADETSSVLEIKNTKMNGNGNAKNGASNTANDVKYPANCAMRLGSSPGGFEGEDNDLYEPKQNKKIWRILTVLVYVFTVSFGAILLSLYYLFLWNPYKDAPIGTLKQIPTPSAQAKNAPAPSTPASNEDQTVVSTSSMVLDGHSTLSDFALDNIVEDLNNGIEPKTLALAIQALAAKEANIITDKNYKIPLHLFHKAQHSTSTTKKFK
jgi:hypothetical protein